MARILVVDDEEGVRTFIADALEVDGHTVVQAADGVEALARLGEQSFHLIVSDLKMPRMDGLALLRAVRARAARGGGGGADRPRDGGERGRGDEGGRLRLPAEAGGEPGRAAAAGEPGARAAPAVGGERGGGDGAASRR